MTATKALTTTSPAKLLNRIRELKKSIEYQAKKIRRQKVDLFTTVYLYVETCCTQQNLEKTDVYTQLSQGVGAHNGYWSNCYNRGLTIRELSLDLEVLIPSALCQLPGPHRIQPQHMKGIAAMLNDGAGPSEMSRYLGKLGYGIYSSKVPSWRRKQIRQSKKAWVDWKPEIQHLAEQILETTDGHATVRLELYINDAERPKLVGRVKK